VVVGLAPAAVVHRVLHRGTYKTVEARYKTVKTRYKTVKARCKTVKARYKTVKARLFVLSSLEEVVVRLAPAAVVHHILRRHTSQLSPDYGIIKTVKA
jgi:hypothetical protein